MVNALKSRIAQHPKTRLIGMSRVMSLKHNETAQLWSSFMQRRFEVTQRDLTHFYSMQVYPVGIPDLSSISQQFTKWAALPVSDTDPIPEGMGDYVLEGGMYAVFTHHGPASLAPQSFGYIFGQWLPASEYELDSREHFEILPEGYNPMDENAEEEIWIPIKYKA